MAEADWRIPAKVVAYLDLIFSVVVACWIAFALRDSVDISKYGNVTDRYTGKRMNGEFWFTVGFLLFVTAVKLWAASLLISGTEIGQRRKDAHNMCATWRQNCVFFVLVTILTSTWVKQKDFMFINVIIQGSMIAIVDQYMFELRSTPRPPPVLPSSTPRPPPVLPSSTPRPPPVLPSAPMMGVSVVKN